MPKDSTPRSFAAVMALSPGSLAPTVASAVLRPDARIRRAADDLQQLPPSAVDGAHLAHLQLVGLRMSRGFDDLRDHHADERRRGGLERFELEAGHGQARAELLRAPRHIDEIAQPGQRNSHGLPRPELRQEAQVVFEEQAQVVHAVAQHGQAIDAHAEGVAGVFLRIDAARFEHACGCTMPQPEISSQPVCLHTRQPAPPHSTQLMSTSADGSVNGKYDGRSRIFRSRSKNASRKPCSMAFMFAKVTPSSTTRPSTW